MKIKFLCAAATLALAFASTAAFADETPELTITGTAAIASQYRFRGISQSDQKPVVQASITVSHKSGFYVSTWASSASAGNSAVNIGGTEIDVYGGYTHALGNSGVTFDGGLYGYLYPGGKTANAGLSINYYELYASLSKAVGPVTLKAGVNFAPKQDYFKDWGTKSKSNAYKYLEAVVAVPNTPVTLHGHVAHSAGGFNWTKEYVDYNVGASYKFKILTLDLSLVGTNVGKKDAGGPNELYRAAKPAGVLSLTAAF